MKASHTFFLLLYFSFACSNQDENLLIESSQLPSYNLEFFVDLESPGPHEPYDFEVTFLTTNMNNFLVPEIINYSGLSNNTFDFITDNKIVKEYKVVGVSVKSMSDNVKGLEVRLTRIADKIEVLNIWHTIINETTILYDFETNNVSVNDN